MKAGGVVMNRVRSSPDSRMCNQWQCCGVLRRRDIGYGMDSMHSVVVKDRVTRKEERDEEKMPSPSCSDDLPK